MIEIVTASQRDIPVIENILMDTVLWLNSVGQPLWHANQITWSKLSENFSYDNFVIVLLDGKPSTCMAVVDYDPVFWPNIAKGQSLFIHKLAVKRFAAGKGLSDALINHAKSMCLNMGISSLRLDCHSLIPKLRNVYKRNGFVCIAEKVLADKFHTAFYSTLQNI